MEKKTLKYRRNRRKVEQRELRVTLRKRDDNSNHKHAIVCGRKDGRSGGMGGDSTTSNTCDVEHERRAHPSLLAAWL